MSLKPCAGVLRVLALALCLAAPSLGQTIFGTILGSVTDASGAVVPNAMIKVTNQGENISREVRSDAKGNYQAENMKEGIYTLTVQAHGFSESIVKDVRLTEANGARRYEVDGWRRGQRKSRSKPTRTGEHRVSGDLRQRHQH